MATLTYMPTEHLPVLAPELIALADPDPAELGLELGEARGCRRGAVDAG